MRRHVVPQGDHRPTEDASGTQFACAAHLQRWAGGAMEQPPAQPVEAAGVAQDAGSASVEHLAPRNGASRSASRIAFTARRAASLAPSIVARSVFVRT